MKKPRAYFDFVIANRLPYRWDTQEISYGGVATACIAMMTPDSVWIGVDDADPRILASRVQEGATGWVKYPMPDDVLMTTRMHLTRDQVENILPILKRFVETGEIK